MTDLLIDSCLLIDFLNHLEPAREFVLAQPKLAASIVSRIEVLTGVRTEIARAHALEFCAEIEWVPLTLPIADHAADVRRDTRLKLPDAVILATAERHGQRIATRNTRDFPADDPRVLVPYTLN